MAALKRTKAGRRWGGLLAVTFHSLAWAALASCGAELSTFVFCFLCCDMALFFSVVSTSGMSGSLKWLDVVLMVAVADCVFGGKIIIKKYIHTCTYACTYVPYKSWALMSTSRLRWLGWGRAEKGGKDVSLVTALNYPVLLDVTIQS